MIFLGNLPQLVNSSSNSEIAVEKNYCYSYIDETNHMKSFKFKELTNGTLVVDAVYEGGSIGDLGIESWPTHTPAFGALLTTFHICP